MRTMTDYICAASDLLEAIGEMTRPTEKTVARKLDKLCPGWSPKEKADVIRLCHFVAERDVSTAMFSPATDFIMKTQKHFRRLVAASGAYSAAWTAGATEAERDRHARSQAASTARLQEIFAPALRGEVPETDEDDEQ